MVRVTRAADDMARRPRPDVPTLRLLAVSLLTGALLAGCGGGPAAAPTRTSYGTRGDESFGHCPPMTMATLRQQDAAFLGRFDLSFDEEHDYTDVTVERWFRGTGTEVVRLESSFESLVYFAQSIPDSRKSEDPGTLLFSGTNGSIDACGTQVATAENLARWERAFAS